MRIQAFRVEAFRVVGGFIRVEAFRGVGGFIQVYAFGLV